MGCLEKIIGSLLGLFFVVAGVWGLVEGSYNGAQCCCFTISGGLFALLNWMTNYEDFESLWESFFQSPITAILGKWAVLGIISFGIGFLISGVIFGWASL